MDYTLSLTFSTVSKENATYTITDVKSDLTEEQVKAIAQTIIDNPIFVSSKGAYVALVSARVTGRETTKLIG